MIEFRSTSYDLSKPLATMAERAKQDGFEFYYTRHIADDVFELELRRDYIGVKTNISGEYMNKYVPQSCVGGVLRVNMTAWPICWEPSRAATTPRRI